MAEIGVPPWLDAKQAVRWGDASRRAEADHLETQTVPEFSRRNGVFCFCPITTAKTENRRGIRAQELLKPH